MWLSFIGLSVWHPLSLKPWAIRFVLISLMRVSKWMLPPACQFHALPLSHVRTCPVEDSLLPLVPLAHAMPCQPRCPWLTPSVSSSWAEPSAYCYRADIFFVHPYRPRLSLSALRLSPFCVLTHRSISGHASAILALSSASKSVQLLCSVYFAYT